MQKESVKKKVQKGYAGILNQRTGSSKLKKLFQCCDPKEMAHDIGLNIGYSQHELDRVPEDANLGIGCGNPTAIASISKGETILDLGSGAGFDCFLAAEKTGPEGKVIGVDMTPEMVKQAQKNAASAKVDNASFLVGEIEDLPLEDQTVDVIISNCVINLSDQKQRVFNEAYRVLNPNGRMMISDIILLKELPNYITESVEGLIACMAGAIRIEGYLEGMKRAGFVDVKVEKQQHFPIELMMNDPIAQKIVKENKLTDAEIATLASSIASVSIGAVKPGV